MKRILTFILLVLNLPLQSQQYEEAPPGTLRLNAKLYIDQAPVSNLMFLEYLTTLKFLKDEGYNSITEYVQTESPNFGRIIILYPSFLQQLDLKGTYLNNASYFLDEKYQDAPVLMVSRKEAMDYCNWRTEMVSYMVSQGRIGLDKSVRYRLPEREELAMAEEHFSGIRKFRFKKGKTPARFNSPRLNDQYVRYNISEYAGQDDFYGTNWKGKPPVDLPNARTGFRCVCEVW